MQTTQNTGLLNFILRYSFITIAFLGPAGKIFAQNSLEVALQIGHHLSGNSGIPKIYAISHDDRWVITSNKNEHSLIVWEIKIGKIYATYPVAFEIKDAVFLTNNEDVLINRSLIFNIHAGKVTRKLGEISAGGGDATVKTGYSLQFNKLVYSVIEKNDRVKALENQYKGYQKGSCTNAAYTTLWGFEHDRVFEYDVSNGSVRRAIDPGAGQIAEINYDPVYDMVVIRGEQKTGYFRGNGVPDLKYIDEPLLNVTFGSNATYLAGISSDPSGAKTALHVWRIDKTPQMIALTNKPAANYVTFFAWFIKGTSDILLYNKNVQSGKYRLKVMDVSTNNTLWEDSQDADYTLSQNENYLIASYNYGSFKIYDTHTFKNLSQGSGKVYQALISPDEKYILQREASRGYGGDQIALYTLPGFTPVYAAMKDSLNYPGSSSSSLNFLFSSDSKELFFYKSGSKIIARFDIDKNVMRRDSLAQPVYDYGQLLFTSDGRYLLSSGSLDKQILIYDAKSLRNIGGKKMTRLISFNTPLANKVFSLYKGGDKDNLVQVENTAGGSVFSYAIDNYLQCFNSSKTGDQFAYCVPKVAGYQLIHRVYIVSTTSKMVTDSLDLPQTETDVNGQLIFSSSGNKLYIGWNSLYEYDIRHKNLRKLPVRAGAKFYPVCESDNGKFLFTYSPQNPMDGAQLVVFDLSSFTIALQASSLLVSFELNSVNYPYMKGYPDLFETQLNYKPYYISTADSVPKLTGPADNTTMPFVLTHDRAKQLNITSYAGFRMFDGHSFKLLNAIVPAQYGHIGFTSNKKYAVQYDEAGLSVYDVQKGFKKVPFIYTVGKFGEYRFFDNRPVNRLETMIMSANGNYLATIDSYGEGAVNIYKFETGELVYRQQAPYLLHSAQKETKDAFGNTPIDPLGYLAMSENEKFVLFNTYNGFLVKADVLAKTEQRLRYPAYINSMDISNSGKWVAVVGGGDHPAIIVWDTTAASKQIPLQLNNDDLGRLRLSIYEQQNVLSLQKADGIYFYDLRTLKLLKQFIDPLIIANGDDSTHTVRITFGNGQSVKYSLPDFAVASAPDKPGQYRFVADGPFQVIMKDTIQVAKFLFDATNKQIMWFTPSNYYFINKESRDAIAFRARHDLYPTSVFDAVFNRPDTVFKILDPVFHFNDDLLKVYHTAYLTRAKTDKINGAGLDNLDKLPAIQMRPVITDNNTSGKNFKANLAATGNTSKPGSYNILVNGVPLFGKNGHRVNQSSLHQQITIPLLPGKNTIEATVTNAAGLKGLPATIVEYLTDSSGFKPHTYFIGVGISEYKNTDYNLNYAAKDIRDITTALHKKDPELMIDTFLNQSATREKIFGLRDKLLHTRPEDRVIFYYCGHGVRKQDYYIGTYSFSFDNPEKEGINIDEIYKLLDSIPARARFMMLDACNSGQYYGPGNANSTPKGANGRGVDPNIKVLPYKLQTLARGATIESGGKTNSSAITVAEIMDDIFADFGNDYGIDVLAAAKGTEVAYETPGFKNGVFTHAMLQAVNTNLDGAYDNKPVTIGSLKKYVSALVINLTGGSQKPVSRNENTEKDWVVW